jgi:type IV pilus assembly protein PilW
MVRGLSLIELMVGIAVGLFIVAAATVLVSGQLGENRRLMLDTQLQQDLRATADIITRELRRANANSPSENFIDYPTRAAQENSLATLGTPKTAGTYTNFSYYYSRATGEFGPWGFRLDGTNGIIQTSLGAVWHDLTDRNVMEVTTFNITIQREPGQVLPCPRLCPTTNDTACWPILQVLNFVVDIQARSRSDPSITRRIQSIARARNDWIEFRTTGSPKPACPN